MFRRNLIPVWVGIILLSGMFLMGQEGWGPTPCIDEDIDGYGDPANATCTYPQLDCDDADPDIHPGAEGLEFDPATCSDGVDNNCNGLIDDDDVFCLSDMATIPSTGPSGFAMGDHFAEGDADELPVHYVEISSFMMDRHEVTNAEYAECVDAGECDAPWKTWSATRGGANGYYGNPAYDDFPVIFVSWPDASDYCAWNAGKRLPTEAEWEYAARGGLAGARYPWGDTITENDANFRWTWGPFDRFDTSEVGSYPGNGYGLFDVAGNVQEWVSDRYKFEDEEPPFYNYYQDCFDAGIVIDPQGAPFPTSAISVQRGGYFLQNADPAYDPNNFWAVSQRDSGLGGGTPFPAEQWDNYSGFRCAKDLP